MTEVELIAGISILISMIALVISIIKLRTELKTKEPIIKLIQPRSMIEFKPSLETFNFEAWIPLVFANEGDSAGSVIIKEHFGESAFFSKIESRYLPLFKDIETRSSNILHLESFSTGTLMVKVGPTDFKQQKIIWEDLDGWIDFECMVNIIFLKTYLAKIKRKLWFDKKTISLTRDGAEIHVKLRLERFVHQDIEELQEKTKPFGISKRSLEKT